MNLTKHISSPLESRTEMRLKLGEQSKKQKWKLKILTHRSEDGSERGLVASSDVSALRLTEQVLRAPRVDRFLGKEAAKRAARKNQCTTPDTRRDALSRAKCTMTRRRLLPSAYLEKPQAGRSSRFADHSRIAQGEKEGFNPPKKSRVAPRTALSAGSVAHDSDGSRNGAMWRRGGRWRE